MSGADVGADATGGVGQVGELRDLRRLLPQLDLSEQKDWHLQLEARKQEEREFHNASKESRELSDLPSTTYELLHGNKKYYDVVGQSRRYLHDWLATQVPGRVFLDYACGNGDQSIVAAQLGAALAIGIDISDVSIANARREAARAGVADRCQFIVADCERTGLPAGSIDVALCSGMLHHLDLQYAFPELCRVLRPGGRVLAVEALEYNPLLKLYRWLTPTMRTEWEKRHILGLADLRLASRFFEVVDVRYWHLLSLLAMPFRAHPALFERALRALDRADSVALRIPGLRLMAWQFTFELVKRPGEAHRG